LHSHNQKKIDKKHTKHKKQNTKNKQRKETGLGYETDTKQEALLSQRGRALLRDCIASIQNVERSLLLLVVSASDIPLRTIKFFSLLFDSSPK